MRWVAGILIVLATTLPGGAQAPAAKQELPDYYPLKPGTKWTYELDPGNGRKIRATNQITKLETLDGKLMARMETVINGRVATTEHLIGTPMGVFRYRMRDIEVSPPVCFLKYPFREGEAWVAEPKIGRLQLKMSFQSGRAEQVTSIAGKYDAVTVAYVIDLNGTPAKTTSWYAPNVGLVKQSTEIGGDKTTTMELVTFEAGK
jgi:hypothetical protein